MLTLYYKPSCRYSQAVLTEGDALGIRFNLKDITGDPSFIDELITQGGRRQVPFLIDAEKKIKLYESAAIVSHLREYYAQAGEPTQGAALPEQEAAVCETCMSEDYR